MLRVILLFMLVYEQSPTIAVCGMVLGNDCNESAHVYGVAILTCIWLQHELNYLGALVLQVNVP